MSRSTFVHPSAKVPKMLTSVAGRDDARAYKELLTDSAGRLKVDASDIAVPVDVSEASLATRIEKPLRAYRREGKCFFASGTGYSTSQTQHVLVLWNPPGSGHKLGLYNVHISVSSQDTGGGAIIWRVRGINDCSPDDDAVYTAGRNLKLGAAHDNDSAIIVAIGPAGSTVGTGTLSMMRQKLSSSSGGVEQILDFQEEIVEIPEGNGVELFMDSNSGNQGLSYSAAFRYVKVPLDEPL